MRNLAPVLLATLAVAVGVAGSSEPHRIVLGESVPLRIGESARIEAERLLIGFEGVPADSRCPKGEQCLREGEATVRVWIRKGAASKETGELHISSQDERALTWLDYEVKLLRLDPYPVSGRMIARGEYVATLEVTRGSSAAPDR